MEGENDGGVAVDGRCSRQRCKRGGGVRLSGGEAWQLGGRNPKPSILNFINLCKTPQLATSHNTQSNVSLFFLPHLCHINNT